jgi:hypothetical protein
VSSVLWAGLAFAQKSASPFELTWQAPAGCPDGASVQKEVIRLARVTEAPERRLSARITVDKVSESDWMLDLQTEVDGILGERTLQGRSCRAVADAAALTLALMLNPEAEQDVPESAPEAPASPPPRSTPAPHPDEQPAADTEHPTLAWRVAGHGGLHLGILPRPGVEFGLGLGVGSGPTSAWLIAGFDPPQDATVDESPDAGGRLWVASVAALGCYGPRFGVASIGACLGLELSRLQGKGVGVSDPDRAAITWASATPAVVLDVHLSRQLAVRAAGLGLVPLARPSVYLDDIGTVHRPAPVGGKILAGLVAQFH